MNASNFVARVTYFESYSDASGAPALIECCGVRWAFDCLGEVRPSLSRGVNHLPASLRKRSLELATKAYEARIAELGAEWHSTNKALYGRP